MGKYEDWLDREDWDIDWDGIEDSDVGQELEDLFGKEGREASPAQIDALTEEIKARRPYQPVVDKVDNARYFRHMGGKYYPRLASVGIKRTTYTRLGVTLTRYQIPGRAGLFSLGSARKIFGNL